MPACIKSTKWQPDLPDLNQIKYWKQTETVTLQNHGEPFQYMELLHTIVEILQLLLSEQSTVNIKELQQNMF